MFKIKEILCDIVKQTYGTDCNPAYLRFFVEISPKNSKSYHGLYNERTHKITIFNTYRDDEAILCTTVHELAHHIDTCNRGKSDHQAPFYAEYEKLLFAAMDMGIIHKEKFLNTTRDASDSNKIRKMMDRYIPKSVAYKSDHYTISVYNSFSCKDVLSQRGYHFNGNTKAWEKEVSDPEKEKEALNHLDGIKIEITKATDLHFKGTSPKPQGYQGTILIAMGDTYSVKEKLSAAGFRYVNKKWIRQIKSAEEEKKIRLAFPNLSFKRK